MSPGLFFCFNRMWCSCCSTGDETAANGTQTDDDDTNELDENPQFSAQSKGNCQSGPLLGLPLKSISLLLVVLCVSAAFLWYRVYSLHTSLETRLQSELSTSRQAAKSLYSPQVGLSTATCFHLVAGCCLAFGLSWCRCKSWSTVYICSYHHGRPPRREGARVIPVCKTRGTALVSFSFLFFYPRVLNVSRFFLNILKKIFLSNNRHN